MTLILAAGESVKVQSGEYREIKVDRSSGLVTGFGEKKNQVSFYTGSAIFEPEAFSHLTFDEVSEFVPEVLEPMIRAGKVGFIESDDLWLDVGSPELWRQAIERLSKTTNLPAWMVNRLKQADPTLAGRFEMNERKIRYDGIEHEA